MLAKINKWKINQSQKKILNIKLIYRHVKTIREFAEQNWVMC